MSLLAFVVSGLIAGAFGILGALFCRSMLREHKVECSGQIEELRRGIGVLELQLQRRGIPPKEAVSRLGAGRREMQLIARISSVLLQ